MTEFRRKEQSVPDKKDHKPRHEPRHEKTVLEIR